MKNSTIQSSDQFAQSVRKSKQSSHRCIYDHRILTNPVPAGQYLQKELSVNFHWERITETKHNRSWVREARDEEFNVCRKGNR